MSYTPVDWTVDCVKEEGVHKKVVTDVFEACYAVKIEVLNCLYMYMSTALGGMQVAKKTICLTILKHVMQ